MTIPMVVGPVLSLDWLEKRRKVFAEIDRQLIQGLENPGKGLTLEILQAVVEHRNPWSIEAAAEIKNMVQSSEPKVLQRVWELDIPAVENFVAADHFIVNNELGIPFMPISKAFRDYFFSRIEEKVPSGILNIHQISKIDEKSYFKEGFIRSELRHDYKVFLSDIWYLLAEEHLNKGATSVLSREWENLFYVQTETGELCMISVYWGKSAAAWRIKPMRLKAGYSFVANSLVFSR